MINLKIDDKPVSVENGASILAAARTLGIYIPTLCDHPALEACGACRVCLVEIKGRNKPVASCVTPAEEGMEVISLSPQLIDERRSIVELILSRHPNDCILCAANGKCELARVCQATGVKVPRYARPEDVVARRALDDSNPFIVRDHGKCILCGRCVRVCERFARYSAVDFQYRSGDIVVDTEPNGRLDDSDCVFCGQCVQVCPTAALTEKTASGHDCLWETSDVKTICPYCGVGCELVIRVNPKTGKIVNIESDYSSGTSFNKGRSCVKGRFAWGFVHSEDRLTSPLLREDGVFRVASWKEALARVASALKETKENYGADAVGFFSSARCTNEENYLLQRLAREVVGTNNVDHCAHL